MWQLRGQDVEEGPEDIVGQISTKRFVEKEEGGVKEGERSWEVTLDGIPVQREGSQLQKTAQRGSSVGTPFL